MQLLYVLVADASRGKCIAQSKPPNGVLVDLDRKKWNFEINPKWGEKNTLHQTWLDFGTFLTWRPTLKSGLVIGVFDGNSENQVSNFADLHNQINLWLERENIERRSKPSQ